MTQPNPETLAEELARRVSVKTETKQRALGITEKKELAKLIDADYALLRADVQQYGAELTRQHTLEVNNRFVDKQEETVTLRAEWEALRERWRTEYNAFVEKCRGRGLRPQSNSNGGYGSNRDLFNTNPISFEIPGKEQAIKQIESEVKYTLDRARHALEKKRMEAQRALLTHGGLPPEARELLASMPDPREVLLNAMQNAPALMALTQAPAAPPEVIEQDDVVEGLVIHEERNFGA